MDWWKENKEANIERGVIHFYTATPTPVVEPVALIAPAPVETPKPEVSLEEMLAQFMGGQIPPTHPKVAESSTPVQTEATKAELIAAVIASGKFPTMDERQLNSLNKDSLESLLA